MHVIATDMQPLILKSLKEGRPGACRFIVDQLFESDSWLLCRQGCQSAK